MSSSATSHVTSFTKQMGGNGCSDANGSRLLTSPSWWSECGQILRWFITPDFAFRSIEEHNFPAWQWQTSRRPHLQRVWGWRKAPCARLDSIFPDLSPIKHVWDVLDQAVRRWHPHLANNDQLRQKEWEYLLQVIIDKLVTSVWWRCVVIRQENEEHSRYVMCDLDIATPIAL